ncbi:hypothetical protein [Methylobacterium gregans]|uniref:Uncharacterized protein n=1 Tax=Methylobacterium gregans TaxID=374424 RepID=A0AA37HQV7_9HYPH|nr:hypothetical protein [Methylobacterium gregans]MDQ0519034.1 hypothetical protein [Methylobacterium gregans]GJD80367.1 hypothetical protein NBEOAGPD_3608 [Methylobacterium gregans]GLS53795.1 hypothetical protein GCM10007886_19780 [Methylobacterium gregans]
MRRLLTGGIKAILAIAALSTAAHWALRVQREQPTTIARAIPEPTTTGSIAPSQTERPAAVAAPARGLDQQHLGALIASHSGEKARVQKASTRETTREARR